MYIGIDVGGTNIGIGIVDDKGNILAEDNIYTNKERNFEDIFTDILNLTEKIIINNGLNFKDIESIGLGLPGIIDVKNGVFIYAANLKLSNYPIKKIFEERFGIETFIENDAKSAAIAESLFGSTRGFENSVTLTLGTGIGAGIMINRKLYRGKNNSAGEFGHMVIINNGEICGCGRKGCWEQYASAGALRRMGVNALKTNQSSLINKLIGWNIDRISAKIIFDAAKQGDTLAKSLIDKYLDFLSIGIANIINILSPDVISIGGGISGQGDRLTIPLKEKVRKKVINIDSMPELRTARFARESGIIGAAFLKFYR